MILFINTSQADLIDLKLIKRRKVVKELVSHESYKHAELLLTMINELVGDVKKIKALVVVSGPGAFSALRLGLATANTLAWSLKLPIIEVSVKEAEENLIEVLDKKLYNKVKGKFIPVTPNYGKEANITKPKKVKK
ncbi:MAG: hypothetical protein COU22_01685 [Candidatus Komeilibacteria bacterium CG10_big_fil_rev_8_21_14_0_10_41_13]|uniref:Gcp-like domain-containing protein n=1 Tax=Candidatus Komeilibacteria bacterium CG10_big_fil_rev_8_21_14_0_10_41_13 TaxID=1974476 RepID=A0A2M6WCK0_9BACT|nr:MAG: hypothetical protein COU22_01685 [Candidatus Komeilibacteria bacterium CG10_big_fil_rev_8_21_14_0_10_41_13]